MKKIIKSIAFVLFLVSGGAISAQTYNNGLIDKTVALVGNEVITIGQLETEVQMMMAQGMISDRNLRCEILENMLTQKLFLNQARLDSLTVNYDNVEMDLNDRINQVLASLGGEKEVEEYFNKPVHKLKNEWREILSEQSLTQQMQQEVMKNAPSMTPDEVEKFYRRTSKDSLPIISTQYKISQIVLYPVKERAAMIVKEKLLDLRNRILNGEKFSMLATLYSQDPGSAGRGGELRMAPKNMYWPAFTDAAVALKPGQVSQIVETPDGFHLIQMIEKDGDMFNARHILIKPEYTSEDRSKAFKTLDSLKHQIAVDSLTFELAARIYSQDPKSAINGGHVADEGSGSLFFDKDQLKPADYAVLKSMEEGNISEPFESLDNEGRGNTIYKIIKLEKVVPSHVANIKEDFNVIQNIANNKNQTDAINEFVKEKQKTNLIIIDDMFKKCDFEREGWIK